jgi:hypothetical protein
MLFERLHGMRPKTEIPHVAKFALMLQHVTFKLTNHVLPRTDLFPFLASCFRSVLQIHSHNVDEAYIAISGPQNVSMAFDVSHMCPASHLSYSNPASLTGGIALQNVACPDATKHSRAYYPQITMYTTCLLAMRKLR